MSSYNKLYNQDTERQMTCKLDIAGCVPQAMLLALAAMFVFAPMTACAHDLWINISSHFVRPGDTTKAYLGWGHHYPFSDFLAPERLESMAILRPDGVVVPVRPGKNGPALPIQVEQEGVYVVGAAMKPGYYTKTAHGHTFKSKKDSQDVISSIWYEKNAKAVFCAGNAQKGAYEKAFGHSIEIIPIDNPCTLKPGSYLKVRVLMHGRPLQGAFVYKSRLGETADKALSCPVKTDTNGIAAIHLETPGIWRIMVKQKEPPHNPALCDFRTYTAFLTIAVHSLQ